MTARTTPIELTVLGAGPAYSDRRGALGAAYLIRSGGEAMLLDLGQGTFPELARRTEPSGITGIVISHLHPDHFIDLVALRHYLRYEFNPPRRVTVHAPASLFERIDALHAEPGFSRATFDAEPLAAGPRSIGRFRVEPARVTHTDESYAIRVSLDDSGVGLVYSGDCGRADDLRPLMRPGDVLLSEVSFGPGPVPVGALHLDAPAVGALAAECQAGRVLLTHLQMGFDAADTVRIVRQLYGGPVELVEPGYETAL